MKDGVIGKKYVWDPLEMKTYSVARNWVGGQFGKWGWRSRIVGYCGQLAEWDIAEWDIAEWDIVEWDNVGSLPPSGSIVK